MPPTVFKLTAKYSDVKLPITKHRTNYVWTITALCCQKAQHYSEEKLMTARMYSIYRSMSKCKTTSARLQTVANH